MNLIELQNQVIIEAVELTRMGAVVTFKAARGKENKETVKKYGNKPDRLPVDRWVNCNIQISRDKVKDVYAFMDSFTVSSDTGGCSDGDIVKLDWELDWSFTRR